MTPQPSPRRAQPGRPRGRGRAARSQSWVAALLVLVGVGVLLYPVLATQFNNVKQREFAARYNQEVAQAAPADLAANLARAHAYNAALEGVPILDPWLTRDAGTPQSGPYRAYLTELASFSSMGRLRVPAARIDLPIEHGTSDQVIARAAGHLYGTALPVGGTGSHSVLTSHTGMATATLFDHLTDLREGDLMFVDVQGQTLAYQVDQIKIVLPNHIDDLKAVPGKDLLTLFTCTPYAINTHRLLVRGHRVPYTESAATAPDQPGPGFVFEPWMYGLLAGAAVGTVLIAIIVAREVAKARRRRAAGARRTRQ